MGQFYFVKMTKVNQKEIFVFNKTYQTIVVPSLRGTSVTWQSITLIGQ